MIRTHCGVLLWRRGENRFYFRRMCPKCGRIFKQRKRLQHTTRKMVEGDL